MEITHHQPDISTPPTPDINIPPTPDKHPVSRFTRAFSALHHRNFRLFWGGQLISLIGTWMQTTGQSWLVLQLTHSAWWLGVVGALQFLPVMLFSLFGGVIADRVPKRKMLLFTQSSAAIQAVILWILVFTGTAQLWHVCVLALLLGTTNAFDMPTRQSFVVDMVGREDISNAVALNSSVFNMARIVGPGIGGLIIAWAGETPLFLLNAISFIPVLIGLAMIDLKALHVNTKKIVEPRQGTFQSLGEGLRYIAHMPAVLLIILVVGAISLFGINFNVMLPLFATDVLQVGPAGYGFISAAFGLGALLCALWLAWDSPKPSIMQIVIGGLVFSVLEILFALSHWFILSLVLIAAVGFAQIAFSAMSNSTLQAISPNHLRGRIMSVYMLVFAGTNPIGNLAMGGMSHLFGAALTLACAGGLSLVAAIGGWFCRKPAIQSVKDYVYLDN